MRDRSGDNSLRDLSFDFLGVFGTANASAEEGSSEAALEIKTAGQEQVSGEEGSTSGIVGAGRRHAWGAVYALRTVGVALVAACIVSLVLTMALNPELTFSGAVALMASRAAALVERARELFA